MCIRDRIYMNDFEKQFINSTRYKDNMKLWTRYVDDVLVIWEGSIEEVHAFINEVNNKDRNLQFKEEIESNPTAPTFISQVKILQRYSHMLYWALI